MRQRGEEDGKDFTREGAGIRKRESCWVSVEGGGQKFCLLVCESVDKVVGEHPEGSQSLGLEVTCPEGMTGITEDEYFESERGKGQP